MRHIYEVETWFGSSADSFTEICRSKDHAAHLAREAAAEDRAVRVTVYASKPLPKKLPVGEVYTRDNPACLPGFYEMIEHVANGKWRQSKDILIRFEGTALDATNIYTQVMKAPLPES